MKEKLGASAPLEAEAPSQTVTWNHNCHMGFACQAQVLAVGEKQQSGRSPLSLPSWTNKTRVAEKGAVKKRHSYEPLATAFTLGDFNYRQVAREGNWAIYEQRWPGSENVCYEVIRIRQEEATTFPSGRSYPAREAYPPSETWGVDGFTLTDKGAAFNKARNKCRRQNRQNQLEQIRRRTGTGTNTN